MSPSDADILLLGHGWTGDFVDEVAKEHGVRVAATTRNARDGTIRWQFDPADESIESYRRLPAAQTIVIVFPITIAGASERLVSLYREAHPDIDPLFVQLGSTGAYDPPAGEKKSIWLDRHSPVDLSQPRVAAEAELLGLRRTTVLNLSGLVGGQRTPRNFVKRVVTSKEALRAKTSVHLIHGYDVARAILAVHKQPELAIGQRWALTDLRVIDWWDLASQLGEGGAEGRDKPALGPEPLWVVELMQENGVKALPRSPEELGRALDSNEFWTTFKLAPLRARFS